MELDENTGQVVTLSDASEWTKSFRNTIAPGEITGHFYGKNMYDAILSQPGCIGIRTYYGIENGEKILILVGVDSDGNDIENGVIVESSGKCPPKCSTINALNS